ncbi:class I SAM-dependent methyltransferase (plasmid) [Haloplanus ruber]|uniref:Class I SAM-dependent methyltransferase n=1 Tax=Haloplanus ruber TaxID=869892 RepID=A0ABD6CV14_9EURY|nr:methyltransferase domain-containing protein [Haloplanus ruber]
MDVLSAAGRQKRDDRDDGDFYDRPRYVTHADDAFCQRLTTLYDELMAPGDRVFDAMGSWVSHLPAADLDYVIGHGLNADELAANDRYDEWFVQDFNEDQSLPLGDEAVDIVCCALSVQYLQYPEAICSEFDRVLDDDGAVVVSFTNRMFPRKAIRAWRSASMAERSDLVASYLRAGGLTVTDRIAEDGATDPFYAAVGRSGTTH